jgi:nucleoside-diphosphate-sugar epimerase
VGVLGANSLVGACLLPLLIQANWNISAFSRKAASPVGGEVDWQQLGDVVSMPVVDAAEPVIPLWICVAPIWVLPTHFAMLESKGVRRVVVLSSTSRFTKQSSTDLEEQAVAQRLVAAEAEVQAWAEHHGVEWVILRPTLIYGLGRDKNITEISRFIRRFGFFPLFGKANGLRQPIHAQDVASICVTALTASNATNHAYNISGGETISYREMVARIFNSLGRRPRLITVPLWFFGLAVVMLRFLPRYRQWSSSMAQRMNMDLVFDHGEAMRDLAFKPRGFVLSVEDVKIGQA